jgi:polysaccharide pyruvyl transferase WcaK-like protein
LLKNTLNPEIIHSVRDSYTEKKLKSIGINAINTACPTMWRLDNARLSKINSSKGKYAVITITDYNKNPQKDKALIDICINNYEEVYIWIQGVGDYRYIQDMERERKLNIIEPNLKAFDEVLENKDVDYIGTRLHAGIRALQKNKRTFIIAIDNRALELGRDFGLKTIKRDDVGNLEELINEKYKLQLNIPYENIQMWKNQFRSAESISFDGKKVYNL